MAQTTIMPNAISRADEKDLTSGTHEDIESNDEKAGQGMNLHGPTYDHQGTEQERALIFKQDLRIIPLCSVCASALSKKCLYLPQRIVHISSMLLGQIKHWKREGRHISKDVHLELN
jgi:hypothetical protein